MGWLWDSQSPVLETLRPSFANPVVAGGSVGGGACLQRAFLWLHSLLPCPCDAVKGNHQIRPRPGWHQAEGLAAGKHGCAGWWLKTGPDPDPHAPEGAIVVRVLSWDLCISLQVWAMQWRPAKKGFRLAVCTCTAGGARLEHTHASGGQLQGSRLSFCTHAAAEAWAGCRCVSNPQWRWRRGIGKSSGNWLQGMRIPVWGRLLYAGDPGQLC